MAAQDGRIDAGGRAGGPAGGRAGERVDGRAGGWACVRRRLVRTVCRCGARVRGVSYGLGRGKRLGPARGADSVALSFSGAVVMLFFCMGVRCLTPHSFRSR